ncbi:palmitoyltransferase [Anaeramoeba ignava]|uniref:Palmitoyltransferase n=1 Tax=Anaeramoeba ignava TaxID=1746090 RepID=A0A9Q0L4U1_ANAIG|nr:palmitoyltransferase [Anaeramoeba ignava]
MCDDDEDYGDCPIWFRKSIFYSPPFILAFLATATYRSILMTNTLYWDEKPLIAKITLFSYHYFLLLYFITLYKSVFTDPGNAKRAVSRFDIENYFVEEKRFCKYCQIFKPERTHHCSHCKMCILKMDHHCPWVSNCIGFYNQKYFILFLFYSLLLTITISIIVFMSFITRTEENKQDIQIKNCYGTFFDFLLALLFVAFSLPFLYTNGRRVLKNVTVIEEIKSRNEEELKKYDLGIIENMKQTLGTNYFLWFFPTYKSVEGDGFFFKQSNKISINEKNLKEIKII